KGATIGSRTWRGSYAANCWRESWADPRVRAEELLVKHLHTVLHVAEVTLLVILVLDRGRSPDHGEGRQELVMSKDDSSMTLNCDGMTIKKGMYSTRVSWEGLESTWHVDGERTQTSSVVPGGLFIWHQDATGTGRQLDMSPGLVQ